jgi:hypothetical protein
MEGRSLAGEAIQNEFSDPEAFHDARQRLLKRYDEGDAAESGPKPRFCLPSPACAKSSLCDRHGPNGDGWHHPPGSYLFRLGSSSGLM